MVLIATLFLSFYECFSCIPEYCERYAKPGDTGAPTEDNPSDEELTEEEYSDDETMAGKPDP